MLAMVMMKKWATVKMVELISESHCQHPPDKISWWQCCDDIFVMIIYYWCYCNILEYGGTDIVLAAQWAHCSVECSVTKLSCICYIAINYWAVPIEFGTQKYIWRQTLLMQSTKVLLGIIHCGCIWRRKVANLELARRSQKFQFLHNTQFVGAGIQIWFLRAYLNFNAMSSQRKKTEKSALCTVHCIRVLCTVSNLQTKIFRWSATSSRWWWWCSW